MTSSVQLGAYTLPNRIVIATNPRSQAGNRLIQPEAVTYYSRRASCGLVITEPTLVTPSNTPSNYPGIYTLQQLSSWKSVTEAVKKQNGKIFLQLWYRLESEKRSDSDRVKIIKLFRRAAQNALVAEFDGIEISLNTDNYSDRNNHKSECQERSQNYMNLFSSVIEEVASIWGKNKIGIKLTAEGGQPQAPPLQGGERLTSKSEFLKIRQFNSIRDFYDFLDYLNFYQIAYLHLTDSVTKNFCQTKIAANWLNLLHSIYSGKVIIGYQDSYQGTKDTIIGYSADLIAFNNLSQLSI